MDTESTRPAIDAPPPPRYATLKAAYRESQTDPYLPPSQKPQKYSTMRELYRDIGRYHFSSLRQGVHRLRTLDNRYDFTLSFLDNKEFLTDKVNMRETLKYHLSYNLHYTIFDKLTGKELYTTHFDQFGRPARAGKRIHLDYSDLPQCPNDAILHIPFGRKARVDCPASALWYDLGYPSLGIEPNQDLVFHLEMDPLEKQSFHVPDAWLSDVKPIHSEDTSQWAPDSEFVAE